MDTHHVEWNTKPDTASCCPFSCGVYLLLLEYHELDDDEHEALNHT